MSRISRYDKSFKSLQAEWDKKLKASGFEDIEDRNSDKEFLKSWHSDYFRCRYTTDEFEAKREYYEMACRFLHEVFFDSDTLLFFGVRDEEREIWELHSKGNSIRDIAALLGVKKCRVEKILSRLVDLMLERA